MFEICFSGILLSNIVLNTELCQDSILQACLHAATITLSVGFTDAHAHNTHSVLAIITRVQQAVTLKSVVDHKWLPFHAPSLDMPSV